VLLPKKNYILASSSPRRQQLLKGLDVEFVVKIPDIDESIIGAEDLYLIPEKLSLLKSQAINIETPDDVIISADTIVILNNKILNKPNNYEEAIRLLQCLSNNKHEVVTGVTIRTLNKTITFSSKTIVYFNELKQEEIIYYVKKYKPYDKAGSYGAQEWIGFIAIKKIEGCFFNVMGLPLSELYNQLLQL